MPLKDYAQQIKRACFLNERDPVGAWNTIYENVTKIKRWLNAMPLEWLTVESARCDLTVRCGERRQFIGVSGPK